MTVHPGPIEQAERMEQLAEDLWGNEYTLKLTLWNDGDYRIVAYHHEPEYHEGEVVRRNFEELWHQESENDPHQAVYVKTWHEGDAHRGEARQVKRGEPQAKQLPRP